ncbi:MarR family winged helix-turn-helix transcriptional regulator [Kutzneria albida]|uniref:HTH marR-type domain-containing protein n=1 Tax=Kutzneria albida DSM 43870 TaxID=1449976 RepID=W5W387_9PSEU|nr:MarR family transcriptional regulator [Kutzneria albida]AHH95643.1 hypothetical protein KALB_2274 [Kutzneria albida DSM 43870]
MRWLSERELRTWQGFLTAATVLTRLVEQQLKEEAGLSHPQYEVLVRLSAAPGGELRMTELAEVAVTSKSGLTYQVGQLEKAGLVRRKSCPSDVRGVVAALTDEGWRKLREVAPGHAELVRRHFVDGLSERQFAALSDGVDALAARLAPQEP